MAGGDDPRTGERTSTAHSWAQLPSTVERGVPGIVVAYDSDRGRGEIEASDGRRFEFHAAAIEDRSRRVEVGISVRFDLGAGPAGAWEASMIRPASPTN